MTKKKQMFILNSNNERENTPTKLDILEKLSVALLSSSRLSATVTSRDMWAMTRASYPLDMGVLDHFANHLASSLTKRDSPRVRLVCEALWACGKMIQ